MDSETNEVELKSVVSDSKHTRFQVNLVDSETPARMRLDSASSDDNKYKSFRQLTREALPRLDNYRNIMSVHVACRPTLDELHNCDMAEKVFLFLSKYLHFLTHIKCFFFHIYCCRIWKLKKTNLVDL